MKAQSLVNLDDSAPDTLEKLPFFQREVFNRLSRVEPALRRQANFLTINFSVGATPFLLREREKRQYFLIQNNSSLNTIFLGFDYQPTASNGVLLIPGSVYEPFEVPTNDLWISASGPNTVGLLVYATER